MELLDVTLHVDYAFDIGYEINLPRAQTLLQGGPSLLPRRKRTPESIRYRPAPLRIPLDTPRISLPGDIPTVHPPRGELAIFDFAALSLSLQFPIRVSPDDLLKLAGHLAEPQELNIEARRLIDPWIERLKPAVIGFEISELSEEYFIFQVHNASAHWLEARADWIAGLVRLEPEPMSRLEVLEANRLSISYTPDDLLLLDWAAGFIADRDCADTLQVIEFANVQLLEFRHIDDRLDDRLEAAYSLIRPERRPKFYRQFFITSHNATVRSVRELEIEATSLFERADNALKLIGDQYLSRVFDLASTRFHLNEWQASIRRKLDTVGDVYDLLVHQSGGRRMEFLEVIVIVLISMEILLTLFRH